MHVNFGEFCTGESEYNTANIDQGTKLTIFSICLIILQDWLIKLQKWGLLEKKPTPLSLYWMQSWNLSYRRYFPSDPVFRSKFIHTHCQPVCGFENNFKYAVVIRVYRSHLTISVFMQTLMVTYRNAEFLWRCIISYGNTCQIRTIPGNTQR